VNRMSRATFPLWFFERAFAGSNTETAPRARSPWRLIAPWTTLALGSSSAGAATSAREQMPPLGPVSPDGGIRKSSPLRTRYIRLAVPAAITVLNRVYVERSHGATGAEQLREIPFLYLSQNGAAAALRPFPSSPVSRTSRW
jgi:hypothetical protein